MNSLSVVEDLARDNRIHSVIAFQGRVMRPSYTENFLIEAYMRTLSLEDCCMEYKNRYGKELNSKKLWNWMNKGYMKEYIEERLRIKAIANGLDEDRWRACGTMMLAEDPSCLELIRKIFKRKVGSEKDFKVTRAMCFMWERLGEANGWLSRGASLQNFQNMEIKVLQANGKE